MNTGAQVTAFSDYENGSIACFHEALEPISLPDVETLRRLSDNLGSLFQSPEFDFYADVRIVAAASELAVHSCVLSAWSPFSRDVFARSKRSPASPMSIELQELAGELDVGLEALAFVLEYIYSGRVGSLPKGVCMCADDECSHAGCRPAVDFMLQVLYTSFTFQISELVSLFQRHLIDILDRVAIDDIPVILSAANLCSRACTRLMIKCVEVKSDLDIATLENALPSDIVKQVMEASAKLRSSGFPDKHVRRIYSALDSDDMELVKMLLKEGHTSLDDAERRNPPIEEPSVLAMAGGDLLGRLVYLENRGNILQNNLLISLKISKSLLISSSVQLGKCFFARCAEVLDKFMDDDLADLASIGHTASDERRKRYLELQDVIARAFTQDKEEFDKSAPHLEQGNDFRPRINHACLTIIRVVTCWHFLLEYFSI